MYIGCYAEGNRGRSCLSCGAPLAPPHPSPRVQLYASVPIAHELLRCVLEISAPSFGSWDGKRERFPGGWCRKLQTHRTICTLESARRLRGGGAGAVAAESGRLYPSQLIAAGGVRGGHGR